MKTKLSRSKKIAIVTAACLVVSMTAFGLYLELANKLPLAPILYDYIIDINDPSAVAGHVDYVFVGRVELQNKTIYENVFERETEDGTETVGFPYTNYDITVLENLKGNLKLNEKVPVLKEGGVSIGNKALVLGEGDFLPEEGDICVFFVSAQKNGTLLLPGKNFNVKITESSLTEKKAKNKSAAQIQKLAQDEEKTIKDSSIYQKLVDACKNETPFERTRYAAPAEMLMP
ncbi:MAG: hypothetical protein LBC83_08685 [Oscillospiraceae bacterium]|jgi:hypothetical protein|nr:hypothetical protein [Oscillospiraceae bacterium]